MNLLDTVAPTLPTRSLAAAYVDPLRSCHLTRRAAMEASMAWAYEGQDVEPHSTAVENVQIAKVGDRVQHDVFDMCTILPGGLKDGKLSVRLDEDGSERELTAGHFQLVMELDTPSAHSAEQSTTGDDANGTNGKSSGTGSVASMGAAVDGSEPTSAAGGADNDGNAVTDERSANVGNAATAAGNESGMETVNDGTCDTGTADNSTGKQGGHENGSNTDDQALLEAVLAKMEAQVDEFGLYDEGADLVFHKRLVMIDTKGVTSKNGVYIQLGQAVRDRGCGHFFVVTRIYKPLLGYLAEPNGIIEDSEGEAHTSALAKGARMLGQNSRFFSGDRDALIVVMHNPGKIFGGFVWTQANALNLSKMLVTDPPLSDVIDALGADYKAAAETALEEWTAMYHKQLDNSYPGGGTALIDSALKGASNILGILKRKHPKPYLVAKEAAEAKEALEALEEEKAAAKAVKAAATRAAAAAKAAKTKAAKAVKAAKAKEQLEQSKRSAGNDFAQPRRKVKICDDDTDDDDAAADDDGDDDGADNDYVEVVEITEPEAKRQARRQPTCPSVAQPTQQRRAKPAKQQPQQPQQAREAEMPVPPGGAGQFANSWGVHVEQRPPRAGLPGAFDSAEQLRRGSQQLEQPRRDEEHGHHGMGEAYMYANAYGGNEKIFAARPLVHQQHGARDMYQEFQAENIPPEYQQQVPPRQQAAGAQRPPQAYPGVPFGAHAGPTVWAQGHAPMQGHYYHPMMAHQAVAPLRETPQHIPMAAFEARAAWEAQQKADALHMHARFMYFRHKYPGMMRDPDE
eukprot:6211951-Pleurochrysis_carterae.AAC.5